MTIYSGAASRHTADVMPVVVDTHVHIYPEYDARRCLDAAARRLLALAPQAVPALCLTERAGQHVYAEWGAAGRVTGTDLSVRLIDGASGEALCVETECRPLYVLPGRQVATAERLEILSLGRGSDVPDGTPAHDVIDEILAAGGLPVLTWAFGKWWFRRAGVVRTLLQQFTPDQLWLGDTSMRPREWPQGSIMREATAAGRRLLAGSDPLPGAAEIRYAGSYATLLSTELDPADPAGAVIDGLRSLRPEGQTVGRRCTLPTLLMRMARQKG